MLLTALLLQLCSADNGGALGEIRTKAYDEWRALESTAIKSCYRFVRTELAYSTVNAPSKEIVEGRVWVDKPSGFHLIEYQFEAPKKGAKHVMARNPDYRFRAREGVGLWLLESVSRISMPEDEAKGFEAEFTQLPRHSYSYRGTELWKALEAPGVAVKNIRVAEKYAEVSVSASESASFPWVPKTEVKFRTIPEKNWSISEVEFRHIPRDVLQVNRLDYDSAGRVTKITVATSKLNDVSKKLAEVTYDIFSYGSDAFDQKMCFVEAYGIPGSSTIETPGRSLRWLWLSALGIVLTLIAFRVMKRIR